MPFLEQRVYFGAISFAASRLRMQKLNSLNMFINDCLIEPAIDTHQTNRLLNGVLVAVKDCFATKNIPTTCGSLMLRHFIPPYSATVVDALVANGCRVVGKTNHDEFCMGSSSTEGAFGIVKNPWSLQMLRNSLPTNYSDILSDDFYIAGGSSGGSAAAVASKIVNIALGSDTGGSVRNPASHCGVVGFKPSYGHLSRHGMIPLVNALDVPGIVASDVEYAAKAYLAMAGRDVKDSTSTESDQFEWPDGRFNVKSLKIGVPKEYNVDDLDQNVLDCWDRVLELFDHAGAQVVPVSLPHTEYSIVCYHVLCACEVASNMARYDGMEFGYRAPGENSVEEMFAESRHNAFNEIVRRRIFAGNFFLLRDNKLSFFEKAQKVRRLIANDFVHVFDKNGSGPQVDLLVTPTALSAAMKYSDFKNTGDRGYDRERRDDYFTQPVNLAGLPAITIPCGYSNIGLPIGIQIIGNISTDSLLLNAAHWLENEINFTALDIDSLIDNLNL